MKTSSNERQPVAVESPEVILYQAIADELLSQRAKAYFTKHGLMPIKHVALFNHQYAYEKEETAYALPAVFIEFASAVYQPLGKQVDNVTDSIRLHVEQKNLADAAYHSANKAKALEVLHTIHAVHLIVSALKSPEFGKFYRVGRTLDTEHGIAPVHIWEYQIQYKDKSTNAYRDYINTTQDRVKLNPAKQATQEMKNENLRMKNYLV